MSAIHVCSPHDRPVALRKLHADLPDQRRPELVIALQSAPLDDDEYWGGLLTAGPPNNPTTVTWVQQTPGRTAVLWPPPADHADSVALMRAVKHYVQSQRIPLVQLLVADEVAICPDHLAAGGFRKLAKLAYMSAEARSAPNDANTISLEPFAGEQPARLAGVIEQTYHGTLDCPQLDGGRSLSDVLEGYRQQGEHDPQQWYFVRRLNRDVGVLLLTDHPATGNWELVYMGVVPTARGSGLGGQIVAAALDAAHRGGAGQLVLAVDAANTPAIRVYTEAGLQVWDYRTVFALLANSPAL